MNEEITTTEQATDKPQTAVSTGTIKIITDPSTVRMSKVQPRPINAAHVEKLKSLMKGDPSGIIRYAPHVREIEEGVYEILSGHHRFVAMTELEMKKIPVRVFPMPDDKLAYIDVANSNTGLPMTMLDHGRLYAKMVENGIDINQSEYGRMVGNKGQSWVAQCKKIADFYWGMPEDTQAEIDEKIADGAISSTHLLIIAQVDDEEQHLPLVNTILSQDQSISNLKALIRQSTKGAELAAETAGATENPPLEPEEGKDATPKAEKQETTKGASAKSASVEDAEVPDAKEDDVASMIMYIVNTIDSLNNQIVEMQANGVESADLEPIMEAVDRITDTLSPTE